VLLELSFGQLSALAKILANLTGKNVFSFPSSLIQNDLEFGTIQFTENLLPITFHHGC
jgi:hypothetical protein